MIAFLLSISNEKDHPKIIGLYKSYHDDMIRFARSLLRKANDPNYYLDGEDAVQSAFYKITKGIHLIDFSKTDNDIKMYVFSIVSNEVSDMLSDYRPWEELVSDIRSFDDERFFEEIHIKEQYNKVVKAIERLDYKYSSVLKLCYFDNMRVKEIAEMLGVSEKTIYTRRDRGREKLIEILKEEK